MRHDSVKTDISRACTDTMADCLPRNPRLLHAAKNSPVCKSQTGEI